MPCTEQQLIAAHKALVTCEENIDAQKALVAMEEQEPETESGEANLPYEHLASQRRYIEGVYQRIKNRIGSPDTFPNFHDYETHLIIQTSNEIAAAFCMTKDSLGGQLGATTEEIAARCVNSESGNSKLKKLNEQLTEEIDELQHENMLLKGRIKR